MTLDRYQDRSGAGFVTSGSFQGRINDVARVCYVDRVPGLWQGSDLVRYRDVTGACLITKNVRFAA